MPHASCQPFNGCFVLRNPSTQHTTKNHPSRRGTRTSVPPKRRNVFTTRRVARPGLGCKSFSNLLSAQPVTLEWVARQPTVKLRCFFFLGHFSSFVFWGGGWEVWMVVRWWLGSFFLKKKCKIE